MLDAFEVMTTSGIVLWRRHYAPVAPALLNAWFADVLIEEKSSATAATTARRDRYTLKWANAKELGLVFVVGMPPLINAPPGASGFIHEISADQRMVGCLPKPPLAVLGRPAACCRQDAVRAGVRRSSAAAPPRHRYRPHPL